jgi:hypothetical protein
MNWKTKARLQNAVAVLPPRLGNALYYFGQSRFGGLRTARPTSRLEAARDVVGRIESQNRSVSGAAFLEIGTGHQMSLPIGLWLCGAARVLTVDLNRYLRKELVHSDIAYICNHSDEISQIFGERGMAPEFRQRLERLHQWDGVTLDRLLQMMNVTYLAPCDAARLQLPEKSFDYHVSYTVLEHIPPDTMIRIFDEGSRVLKDDGLFVHCIDFTDHCSHADASISSINFLQFGDDRWRKIAGNRFMYHNRIRMDDFEALLREAHLEVYLLEPSVDAHARSLLDKNGLILDQRFHAKSKEVNATSHAWMVAGIARASSSV